MHRKTKLFWQPFVQHWDAVLSDTFLLFYLIVFQCTFPFARSASQLSFAAGAFGPRLSWI
jgi:hypothetical protein